MCRDYAHLVVALLRAVNVPARLVAVYAPGCQPMDFHAVAEAYVNGQWHVVDATCLAPRQTLVRISTGRDAADTAFLDNHRGSITLNSSVVSAWVDGPLAVRRRPTTWCAFSSVGYSPALQVLLRRTAQLNDPGRPDEERQQAACDGASSSATPTGSCHAQPNM